MCGSSVDWKVDKVGQNNKKISNKFSLLRLIIITNIYVLLEYWSTSYSVSAFHCATERRAARDAGDPLGLQLYDLSVLAESMSVILCIPAW